MLSRIVIRFLPAIAGLACLASTTLGQGKTAEASATTSIQPVRSIDAAGQSARTVVFTPDGQQVAVGDVTGMTRLFRFDTGEQVREFRGHTAEVLSVAISEDGRFLLSVSRDKTARLFRADTAELVRQFDLTDEGRSGDMSRDGSVIAVGSRDGIVRVHRQDGTEIARFEEGNEIVGVRIVRDGHRLLSAARNGNAVFRDVDAKREIARFNAGRGIASVDMSRDGACGVCGTLDGRAMTFDPTAGSARQTYDRMGDTVFSVALSADGSRLLAASSSRFVVLETGNVREIARLNRPTDEGTARTGAISRDGARAGIGGDRTGAGDEARHRTVQVFDLGGAR